MALWCCGADGTSSVTSKNAAQLRSLEAMGLSRGHSPRLRRTEVQVPVTLNVYSLIESNKRLSKMGMGVFHTGVVVYGIEWGYGEVVDNPNASGLFCVHPGQAAGTLYRTIRIGHTTRSPMQVDTILHRLENEWRSSDYHILHHNCNHFAQAFCDLLSTTEKLQVPSWCNRAARVGDRVIPRRLATKVQHMMDDEPPKAAAPPTPASNISEVPTSVVPHEWYLHPSICQPLRYIDESKPLSVVTQDGHSASASVAAVDGGGSHYSAECDIVPPPGYEMTDTGSVCPPITRRETYCSTDEKGSITHMMAIEEQPSVAPSSRRESACKSTASQRAAKTTSGHSPAPPSPGIAFSSGGEDRVVLPRMRASTSQSYSVAPTGSPQASEIEIDVENVLQSETSEEPSPPVMSHLPMISSPNRGIVNPRKATPSGSTTSRQQGASFEQQHHVENDSRDKGAEASSKKPLCMICSSSMESMSEELSDHGGSSAQPHSSFLATSNAMPVGCITTLLSTSPNPSAEEATRRSSSMMAGERDVSTGVANMSSEVSNNTSGDFASVKHKHRTQATTTSSAIKEQKPKREPGNEFSDITGALVCDAPLSSATAEASPAGIKRKNSSAWKLLKNQCGLSSKTGSGNAVCKYLSTPSASLTSSSSFSLLQPEAHDDKEAVSVAADSGAVDPAADSALASRQERGHTHVLLSASASPPSPHSTPVALERKYSGHDAVSNEVQDANGTTPMPTTAALQNAPRVPHLGGDPPTSATELMPQSPEQRLSRSETSSAQGDVPSPVSPPDLDPATTASRPTDSPGPQLPPSFVTPERPNIITNSGAVTTGCSPAAAHQQCRRASSSAAMSDSPPPQRERCRTPIPFAGRRRGNDENVAPALRLDLDSDEAEPPVRRSNSRTAVEAGTPSTADKTAHAPMVPCSCGPSSLRREETATGDGRTGENASSDCSQAPLAVQPSLNTELADPTRLSPTPLESIPAPEANQPPTLPPCGTH
ncbi:peptidase PPPDE3 [Leishmania donovani]|nr:peptidase PPPDE3 [Leishmania donovani]VDZ45012.1 PPPDE_putative_peptidase_domain_containing_protein_putative/Pfam:PF05903 [Leishmania donovani]